MTRPYIEISGKRANEARKEISFVVTQTEETYKTVDGSASRPMQQVALTFSGLTASKGKIRGHVKPAAEYYGRESVTVLWSAAGLTEFADMLEYVAGKIRAASFELIPEGKQCAHCGAGYASHHCPDAPGQVDYYSDHGTGGIAEPGDEEYESIMAGRCHRCSKNYSGVE